MFDSTINKEYLKKALTDPSLIVIKKLPYIGFSGDTKLITSYSEVSPMANFMILSKTHKNTYEESREEFRVELCKEFNLSLMRIGHKNELIDIYLSGEKSHPTTKKELETYIAGISNKKIPSALSVDEKQNDNSMENAPGHRPI